MKLLGSRMRLSNDTETNGWQGINMCQYLFLRDFAKSNSNTEVIIFKRFFFFIMYVHVSVDGFVNVDAVPTEARRGHRVPWSRSWRQWRAI